MQADVGLAEVVSDQDQIAEVSGQPIEFPDEDVRHVASLDHGSDSLQPWPIEVLARLTWIGDDHDLT